MNLSSSSLALAGPAPGLTFASTDAVKPHMRFDYWVSLICETFTALECQALSEAAMSGSIGTLSVESLQLVHVRAGGQKVRRTAAQVGACADDGLLIQLQREGRCVVCQDGRTAVTRPGDLVLYDSMRPYELIFDDLIHDAWVIRLPRGLLECHVSGLDELTASTVESGQLAARMLGQMIGALERDPKGLHPAAAYSTSEALASTVAAGLRSLPGANARKPSNLASYQLVRARAHVQQHLRDPELSIGSIAQAMRMSPDSLCRLFRNEPLPLSRWLWQQRLHACRRDLGDPRLAKRSISEIAYSWGFSDAAHFSRSFKELYGQTPRELRAVQAASRAG